MSLPFFLSPFSPSLYPMPSDGENGESAIGFAPSFTLDI
jgi:hypothetical protein